MDLRVFSIERFAKITLFISVCAVCFSVFAEYILNKEPCELCMISRYSYLLIMTTSFFSLCKKYKNFLIYVLYCSIFLSFLFSFYHLGVENHWWNAPESCASSLPSIDSIKSDVFNKEYVPCDQVNWTIFGLSSTLYNFCIMGFLAWMASISYVLLTFWKKHG